MSDHLRGIEIQRLSVDDLGIDERVRAQAHIDACETCRGKLDALKAATQSFNDKRAPEHFMMQLAARSARERRRRTALFGSIGSFAAIAAAVMFFVGPRGDHLRMKGGGVNVICKRGNVVHTLGPDERIRAGDALELARVTSGKLAAWAVDDKGQVSALTDGIVTLGANETLSSSAVVDSPCTDLDLVIADQPPYEVADPAAATKSAPKGVTVRHLRCE